MKIAVLNGSPKGMASVTMQYVLFLGKRSPQHEFKLLHVCHDLKQLEESPEAFQEVLQVVRASDAVLWAFPLYVFLVHAHYKRFIELIAERRASEAFAGKYAALFSTSVRVFDHTAHRYLHGICDDLDMRCVGSYSAAMYDLLKPRERDRLVLFMDGFLRAIEEKAMTAKAYAPIRPSTFAYAPGAAGAPVALQGKKAIVLTDAEGRQTNLDRMLDRLRACSADPVEVVNLHKLNIRGPCLGCIQCSFDNVCVYRNADDVYAAYARLKAADILIFAGSMRDRYLSSRWKLFWDRGFYHNHIPIFSGKQIAWLVSGPLGQVPNLRHILEASAQLQQANLVGIVTDESEDSTTIDRLLECLVRDAVRQAQTGYIQPPTFDGVAGRKLLRDEIWTSLRSVFPADHRYYKRHGLYDFPARDAKTRIRDTLLVLLNKIPSFRRQFRQRIKTEMLRPLEEVLEKCAETETRR